MTRLFLSFSALLWLAAPLFAQDEPAAVRIVAQEQEQSAEAAPAPPEPQIALDTNDAQISRRLNGLFAELSGLEEVRAGVTEGVVTLSGKTLTAEEKQRAESVAARLAGVVSVENEITIEHDVGRRLKPLVGRVQSIGTDVIAFLPLLAIALVVFIGLWLLGRLFTRTGGLFGRLAPNPLVQTLFGQVIRLGFILVGLILAMRIMGASALLGSVLGAAGVFGLAVGFAIRDTIENYIASILLSIRRPFAPNDLVIIEGYEGRVTRLNSRATFLTTLAGNEVRIPNAIVYKAKIENFTRIPERRFEFTVGIGYDDEACNAMAIAHRATVSASGVLADPDPVVVIDTLGDSTVSLKVQAWVDQDKSDFAKTRSAAMRAVKEAFEDEGISMPEPITNIRVMENPPAGKKPKRRSPPKADETAVADTAADRTIEGKVASLRSSSEQDLLSTAAPRE